MTPLDPEKFSFHLSIREWNTLTDEVIRPVHMQVFPRFRACHDFLIRYSSLNKCTAPPAPAYFMQRFEDEWDDELDLSEIGFDVVVPGLSSYAVHKVAILMHED